MFYLFQHLELLSFLFLLAKFLFFLFGSYQHLILFVNFMETSMWLMP